jgi:membrane carboxypeptidase/penicillin-binding protein
MLSDTGIAGMARPAVRAALRFPWKLFFVLVGLAVFVSAGAVFGVVQWLRKDLASPEAMLAIQPPVKTVVYDARGRVLHEFFNENRSSVPLRQIPRHLINATIATSTGASTCGGSPGPP